LLKRWCLSEFFNFFEECKCVLAEFGRRAVAAPDHGQIDDPRHNAEHQRRCVETYRAYLQENPGLDDATHKQVRRLNRWADELSNLLATFADPLGDFGLSELAANDYVLMIAALECKFAATNAEARERDRLRKQSVS
jgi:hypothetical protein